MSDQGQQAQGAYPLVVDLDGSLLKTDLLYECVLLLLRQKPKQFFHTVRWLGKGKAHLKTRLAEAVHLDSQLLPLHPGVVDVIEQARSQQRPIVIATASHADLAHAVARRLGNIAQVISTDESINMIGTVKRDALLTAFGEKGFDYVGDSSADLHVWPHARVAYAVHPSRRVWSKLKNSQPNAQLITEPRNAVRLWSKQLRLHQWAKNILLFVPMIAAHEFTQAQDWLLLLLAFVCFGLCASSVYVANDLLDVMDDRRHPSKSARPFASGNLSLLHGALVSPLLLILGVSLGGLLVSPSFGLVLAVYALVSSLYSFSLKKYAVIDVLTLAMLYTLRLTAGAVAVQLPLSFWMLAFSLFLFLSLAFCKRYAELLRVKPIDGEVKALGRGYVASDMGLISSMGVAAGYLSVLVVALYINDTATLKLYPDSRLIWLGCPILLFWISRVWLLTHRGQMEDDPVVFALTDRISLLCGVLFVLVFWWAS